MADADDVAKRVGLAWRELRRGASMGVLREQFLGTGDDALEPGQMDTLDVLVTAEAWRMGDLADALRVDPSTATRAVERLTRIHLAERLSGPDDRRVVLVRATAMGRARHDEAYGRWRRVMDGILSEFEPAERDELASYLERLVIALDREVGTTASNR
jgi:DNA-binding MarR family transcriptional regulator